MIVWLDGALRSAIDARIDPMDRGFTLGDGLFETICARGGKILRLSSHLERLRRGCVVLGIPYPNIDIAQALADVLAKNNLSDAALRLTLSRGPAARGLLPPKDATPTLLIAAAPLQETGPVSCIVATATRRNEHSPLARIKSLAALDNILARREAEMRGADDAILLNASGIVAEATYANIFVLRQGRAATPTVADGALPGVMRAAVLAACNGIEESLEPEDLEGAEGIFLTNSLGIRPVISLDGKPVRDSSAFAAELEKKLTSL